ncbi:hypothetical protein GCM10023237_36640 [Streptomyces coeruleoprunus]
MYFPYSVRMSVTRTDGPAEVSRIDQGWLFGKECVASGELIKGAYANGEENAPRRPARGPGGA